MYEIVLYEYEVYVREVCVRAYKNGLNHRSLIVMHERNLYELREVCSYEKMKTRDSANNKNNLLAHTL